MRGAGASPVFPANVFSLSLSERRKLGKGVRRAPAAYTMSGAFTRWAVPPDICLQPAAVQGLHTSLISPDIASWHTLAACLVAGPQGSPHIAS